MTPDSLHLLVGEIGRERLQEAQRARLASEWRMPRRHSLAPRWSESIGRLLASRREVIAR